MALKQNNCDIEDIINRSSALEELFEQLRTRNEVLRNSVTQHESRIGPHSYEILKELDRIEDAILCGTGPAQRLLDHLRQIAGMLTEIESLLQKTKSEEQYNGNSV